MSSIREQFSIFAITCGGKKTRKVLYDRTLFFLSSVIFTVFVVAAVP